MAFGKKVKSGASTAMNVASTFIRGGGQAVAASGQRTNAADTITTFEKSADVLDLAKEIADDVRRMNGNARARINSTMTGQDQKDALAILDKLDQEVADLLTQGFKPLDEWVKDRAGKMRASLS